MAVPLLVVYAAENNLPYNRLGLSVSKKVGGAVIRNCLRRLVKESLRLKIGLAQGYDFIVIMRVSSGKLSRKGSFAIVDGSLSQSFKRFGIERSDASD